MLNIFSIEKDKEVEEQNKIPGIEELESRLGITLSNMVEHKRSSAKTINILLAEDNDDDFFFISEALNKALSNYQFEWVKNGKEVIDHLENCFNINQMPDLLLLDINMPKLNGHQVLKQLRADDRFTKLLTIVLTSSKSPYDVDTAYQNGADSFLIKNTKFDKLVKAIESLNNFWFETAIAPNSKTAE